MTAISKYFSHILVFLLTALIFMLIIFSTRYETNVTEVKQGRECLILTNLFTGNSCLIGGSDWCSDWDYYDNLQKCE